MLRLFVGGVSRRRCTAEPNRAFDPNLPHAYAYYMTLYPDTLPEFGRGSADPESIRVTSSCFTPSPQRAAARLRATIDLNNAT